MMRTAHLSTVALGWTLMSWAMLSLSSRRYVQRPSHAARDGGQDRTGVVSTCDMQVEQEADTVAVDSLAEKDADAEILAGAGATYHAGHPGPAHPSIPSTRFLLMRMVGNDLPPKHQVRGVP